MITLITEIFNTMVDMYQSGNLPVAIGGFAPAISGLASIAGSVFNYFMQPDAPAYNTKGANKAIKDYQKNALGAWDNIRDVEFNYSEQDMYNAATGAFNYNQKNLGAYAQQATSIYQTDVANKMAAINQMNPSFFEEMKLAGANNLAYLKGEIPQDMQRAAARTGAFGAGAGGTGAASGIAGLRTARDLGMGSLALTQIGDKSSQGWGALTNAMLPTQTSVKDILSFSGISSNVAIETSFNSAAKQLEAGIANQRTDIYKASGISDIYGNVLSTKLGVLSNDYSSKTNQTVTESNKLNSLTSGITSGIGGIFGGMGGQSAGKSNYGTSSLFGGA